MSSKTADLKYYFLTFFATLGAIFDIVADYFQKKITSSLLSAWTEKWEERIAALVNRGDRWIAFLPLVSGLIIVFAVFGEGFFNWFVLAVFLLVLGVFMIGTE